MSHQLGLALKDKTILVKQIKNNDVNNELIPTALKEGLVLKESGILKSQIVGITKPVRNKSGDVIDLRVYNSINLNELVEEVLSGVKKQVMKKVR
jgi:hypothetical protein